LDDRVPALGRPLKNADAIPGGAFVTRAGETFLFGSDGGQTYSRWDARRQHVTRKEIKRGFVTLDVEWNSRSPVFAIANVDGKVLLVDSRTGDYRALGGNTDQLYSVALSPDGRLVAAGAAGGSVFVWDAATRRSIRRLNAGGGGAVWGVAFSPNGRTLAVDSLDGTVALYDVASHRALHSLDA